jgi:hypothetical protein
MGPDEDHCHVYKGTEPTVKLIHSSDTRECYFADCVLNEMPTRAYRQQCNYYLKDHSCVTAILSTPNIT